MGLVGERVTLSQNVCKYRCFWHETCENTVNNEVLQKTARKPGFWQLVAKKNVVFAVFRECAPVSGGKKYANTHGFELPGLICGQNDASYSVS